MSYSKIIKKTIFNIILLGVVSFAVLYVGVMFTISLEVLSNIFVSLLKFGGFFLAAMIFLWKLSETEGYTLGLAKQFDRKKYLKGVSLGLAINFAVCAILLLIPGIQIIPVALNYYIIFPLELLTDNFNVPTIPAVYISLAVDTPIILAVMFFGACSGDKYATFIRESTKNENDSSELLEHERTTTPRKPGTSWRDSVK
ncbi:MAG: hypothetical protein IJB44_06700 [Clostridia bacterium]|nr:hypothetical protein [Clostridia bacterium]